MSKNVFRAAGFTIVELLVAVTIIGILASAAIPTFVRYQKKSRTVEMYEGVSKVAAGAKVYYTEHSRLPPSTDNSVDNWTPLMTHAERCTQGHSRFPETSLADFDTDKWVNLLFRPADRPYYRYQFENTSDMAADPAVVSGTARARGDLDCDGEFSLFEMWLERDGGIGGPLLQRGTFCIVGIDTE